MTHYPDIYAYMTKYSKANAIEGVRAVKDGLVSVTAIIIIIIIIIMTHY